MSKVWFITGSSRGLGRTLAEAVLAAGHQLVASARNPKQLDDLVQRYGQQIRPVALDVSDADAATKAVQTAIDAFGRIDVVVNNAGYPWVGPLHEMADEQWQAMLDCHLTAPFQLLRATADVLLELAKKEKDNGGAQSRKVVNVSSVAGTRGLAGAANYAAAKAGLVGLTKSLAREWAPYNIQANAVAFGQIATRLTGPVEDGLKIQRKDTEIPLGIPSHGRKVWSEMHPMGRPGTVHEAAGVILFFASPLSNYVSGQVLEVTGGI